MKRLLDWLLCTTAVSSLCLGQTLPKPQPRLELHLQAEDLHAGVPDTFLVTLVNGSNSDILLPAPPVQCEDPTLDGRVWLHDNFIPLNPNENRVFENCTNDRMDLRPILERIKDWKTLRPGEFLSITATRKRFHDLTNSAGVYEFWVDYDPPSMSPENRGILNSTGLVYPNLSLTSNHLTFQRLR